MMETAKKLLSDNGLKCTKQRIEVINELIKANAPLTADMIYSGLEKISLSTVYRILEKLEGKEIVERYLFANSMEVHYELSANKHKHYAVCLSCNEMHEIDICPVHDTKLDNFTVTGHRVELYGYCDKCKKECV